MLQLGITPSQMMGLVRRMAELTFAQLRQNAEELNIAYIQDGQPEPIPNYGQLRKAELLDRINHCNADIDAEISEFNLEYSRFQSDDND